MDRREKTRHATPALNRRTREVRARPSHAAVIQEPEGHHLPSCREHERRPLAGQCWIHAGSSPPRSGMMIEVVEKALGAAQGRQVSKSSVSAQHNRLTPPAAWGWTSDGGGTVYRGRIRRSTEMRISVIAAVPVDTLMPPCCVCEDPTDIRSKDCDPSPLSLLADQPSCRPHKTSNPSSPFGPMILPAP